MSVNLAQYHQLQKELSSSLTTLIAVSKTKPNEDVMGLYEVGQRDFGENYVQELVAKAESLPKDIRWHFIGHLQSNKIKYIAPFVHLIHGVDSLKLLEAINKEGRKINRVIQCLLQVHIASEETKFGLNPEEALDATKKIFQDKGHEHVVVRGLMGMASFSDDASQVRKEFQRLKALYDLIKSDESTPLSFDILSMGMSGDYKIAIEEGSNMVRVGSLLFGARN